MVPLEELFVANNAKNEDNWYTNTQVDLPVTDSRFAIPVPQAVTLQVQVVYACWAENPFKISRAF